MTNKPKISTPFNAGELISKIAWISIFFAILCFVTIKFTGFEKIVSDEIFEKNGGEIGPIETKGTNTIFKVDVNQKLFPNSWSVVNVTVLDENRTELFTVAGDLWAEQGYDGGYWNESDLDFSADFTLYDPGKYYFLVETELSADPSKIEKMSFKLWKKGSSSIPFVFAGFVSMILGILLFIFKNNIISFF